MQIYGDSPRMIVMDIRAFLLSNKTTKGLKRASDDSAGGSTSTCKSSSKRKFVRTWLKDFPWLTYDVEANQMLMLDFKLQTSTSAVGFLFVEFSKIYHCIVTKHTRQDAFKFFLCCSFYTVTFDNNRIFDIFFNLCCTEVPRLVETRLWLVKPEHVLAI